MKQCQGKLEVQSVPPHVLQRAASDPYGLLYIGATHDPLHEALKLENWEAIGCSLTGQFLYSQVHNIRREEDYLLYIARTCRSRCILNQSWFSSRPDEPGYVYVILGRVLRSDGSCIRAQQPGPPGPLPLQAQCCTIM